jgi:hypothetical protein
MKISISNGYFHSSALPSFLPQQAAASFSSAVRLRKPAKLATQTSLRAGLRLAGTGVCYRSHQNIFILKMP